MKSLSPAPEWLEKFDGEPGDVAEGSGEGNCKSDIGGWMTLDVFAVRGGCPADEAGERGEF